MRLWPVTSRATASCSSSSTSPCDRRFRYLVYGGVSVWLLGVAMLVQADPGALTQLECINEDGNVGCADGRGLSGAYSVAVSPDGKHVYVAAVGDGGVAVFERNKRTGTLTQPAGTGGCIREGGDGV